MGVVALVAFVVDGAVAFAFLLLLEHAPVSVSATTTAPSAWRLFETRVLDRCRCTEAKRTPQPHSVRRARVHGYARRMVTVRVDADLCVGHGRCYALAPDVFGTDEFGHSIVLEEQIDEAQRAQAQLGADNCPEQAITIEAIS